jgi:chromatin remodeling complex protein RSC6
MDGRRSFRKAVPGDSLRRALGRAEETRLKRGRTDMADNTGTKNNALQQPLQPSPALAAVVGSGKLARGEVVSKIWDYIKKNNLQNPANKREILADAKLKPVFDGKDKVTMFEMNKYLAKHLTK